MTLLAQVRQLARGRWFRRLLAVRMVSQGGDGVFQVALASYALFSDAQPSAAAIAAALAVVLLPFSVIGPFAGVLLDRWSRRQVLVWANLVRVALVALVLVVVVEDLPEGVFYVVALVCLSVNRFLLAGLSAALPHTVGRGELVTANAVAPTSGTLSFVVGLGVGTLTRALGGDEGVLLAAAALYAAAGLLALRLPRPLLGPDFDPARPATREAVRHVLPGLRAGLRHLRERRGPAAALAVIPAQRFCFGISSVALVLLFRNYFHTPAESDQAFADLTLAALVTGAGFVSAAVVTPLATARVAPRTWVLTLLLGAGAVQLFPGLLFTQTALLVASFLLGLASQGIKICVDAIVQAGVDDAFRGRVFSLYDVLFNVAFVAAAATAAVVLPTTGRSPAVLAASALGYVLTAVLYARVTGGGVATPQEDAAARPAGATPPALPPR